MRVLYLLIFFSVLGCKKEQPYFTYVPEQMIGYWSLSGYADSLTVYSKIPAFTDAPGICFQENGFFIERQNSGWCGTPPVTYSDYKGKYALKDSLLVIESAYWGGSYRSEWKLQEVTHDTLKLVMKNIIYPNLK